MMPPTQAETGTAFIVARSGRGVRAINSTKPVATTPVRKTKKEAMTGPFSAVPS
jgi:hypothetical protein